jgi:ABC-type branched-subunit amino acid transport system ATPase component
MSELPIHARALTKRCNGRTAVDGIDVAVAREEAFGFLGPSRAGKVGRLGPSCGAPTTKGRAARHLCAASRPDDWTGRSSSITDLVAIA